MVPKVVCDEKDKLGLDSFGYMLLLILKSKR